MKERVKELQKLATTTRITGFGEVETVDNEEFAELLIKDILEVAAAHALLNKSALDLYKQLEKIYAKID